MGFFENKILQICDLSSIKKSTIEEREKTKNNFSTTSAKFK